MYDISISRLKICFKNGLVKSKLILSESIKHLATILPMILNIVLKLGVNFENS
jgi:hypothetical protein